VVAVPIDPLTDTTEITRALEACRMQCGVALSAGLKTVFGDDDLLSGMQKIVAGSGGWNIPTQRFYTVDRVIFLDGRYLLTTGWLTKRNDMLESAMLVTGRDRIDITHGLTRFMRSDLIPLYPWSAASEALGFVCILEMRKTPAAKVLITLRTRSGDEQTQECNVTTMGWNDFSELICRSDNDLSLSVLRMLDGIDPVADSMRFRDKLAVLHSRNMQAKYAMLGVHVENPDSIFASVDRGIPLGNDGLLVFGWFLNVGGRLKSVKIYNAEGRAVPVQTIPLLRRDVQNAYRERLPGTSSMCGFVCLAPVSTQAGDRRVLAFDFGELGEIWLMIPTSRPDTAGIGLAQMLIDLVPEPMSMTHALYELFDRALGPAIQAVTRRYNADAAEVAQRQFGVEPERITWSVIVPLYRRYDFMRFQLSHFADDPDFAECDLVYVVDDPEIVNDVLALAARYQPLFGVPFRVLWYGQNRGFAGANNIGVAHAYAESVVLMNSDVLPRNHGWLGQLQHALDSLDGAGAVGPLLEFADGSVQHAGMRPATDEALPGFILNSHVQMGTGWDGGDQPLEQIMLTAACLMMSRENYLSAGGLDEGYLVGDFEDSDLCLILRKRGYRLWLVPAARLWHLERQSVSQSGTASARQMITLYNGWRYRQKILRGELADPRGLEVMQ
jgi:GT2 family glycosyltransferase